MSAPDRPILCLLDGMALLYRAHFAFINNPRMTSSGVNSSAIFGFANTMLELLKSLQPTHFAVAMDTPEPTQRHKDFPDYKAQREAMPEDIGAAIPLLDTLCAAVRVPLLKAPGYEADDIIGTLAKAAERQGFTVYMVTPDKDFAQLVSDQVLLYRPNREGGWDKLGVAGACAKWGVAKPEQVIDLLGLMGDASDNIPGVRGVGEKTAQRLIAEFGSIDNLLANTAKLKGKQKEMIETQRDAALLSKRLATIILDVPLALDVEGLRCQAPDLPATRKFFDELEFRTLGKRWFGAAFEAAAPGTVIADTIASQPDLLFDVPAASTPAAAPAAAEELAEGEVEAALAAAEEGGETGGEGGTTVTGGVPLKTVAEVAHEYHLVDTPAARAALLALLAQQPAFAFDLETTSLNPRQASVVGIGISFAAHTGYYLPVPAEADAARAFLEEFRELLARPTLILVGHNLNYDVSVLHWQGLAVGAQLWDTMVAHYVLHPDLRHGMDVVSEMVLRYRPVPITALIGTGAQQKSMRDVPIPQVAEYCAEDADVTWQLYEALRPQLAAAHADKIFADIEAPLLPVLIAMEAEGIRLDTSALADFSVQLEQDITRLEGQVFAAAGTSFNLDSPKQLGEILFDRLKLLSTAKRTAKTAQYATSEQVLAGLALKHPIVRDVLDFRQLRKLKGTYVDTLPGTVEPRTGRVHTTFSQAVAATGRLASINPNLQNIPVRSDAGREIRKAFVPRNDQYELLSADYSQIELRLIAHISGDAGLRDAFAQGLDIHRATAARVYGVALDAVTDEMRRKAKMVNFGISYGISAFGLAQRLGIGRPEAAEIITNYFTQFPLVKKYISDTIAFAREHGYVQTLLGRRRYLRDINSRNATTRAGAERTAINAPIQGSAADMIKLAMIHVARQLNDGGFRTRMLLQVHDELVFDLLKTERDDVLPLVRDAMVQALPLSVPVVVDLGVGQNWLEAH